MTRYLIPLASLCLLALQSTSSYGQFLPEQNAANWDENEERYVWEFNIEKRQPEDSLQDEEGRQAALYHGWYLDVDEKSEIRDGVARNLRMAWNGKSEHCVWEVRAAGRFSDVDASYIINRGDGKFHNWYLGIDQETGELVLYKDAEPMSTKWLLVWAGTQAGDDLFQVRNVGLGPYNGAYLSIDDLAQHTEGIAQNVDLRSNGRDRRTFWTFRRHRRAGDNPSFSPYGGRVSSPYFGE